MFMWTGLGCPRAPGFVSDIPVVKKGDWDEAVSPISRSCGESNATWSGRPIGIIHFDPAKEPESIYTSVKHNE